MNEFLEVFIILRNIDIDMTNNSEVDFYSYYIELIDILEYILEDYKLEREDIIEEFEDLYDILERNYNNGNIRSAFAALSNLREFFDNLRSQIKRYV